MVFPAPIVLANAAAPPLGASQSPECPTDTACATADAGSLVLPSESDAGSLVLPSESDAGSLVLPSESDAGSLVLPSESDAGSLVLPSETDAGSLVLPSETAADAGQPPGGEEPEPVSVDSVAVDDAARIEQLRLFVFGGGVHAGFEEAVWQWHQLVVSNFPQHAWGTALCVMSYESGGDPSAVYANPGDPTPDGIDSVGLYQVDWDNLAGRNRIAALEHWGYHTRPQAEAQLLDPETNVRAAAEMHADDGWLPGWNAQRTRCGLDD